MGRGIGNRQKKVVVPRKVWIKPSSSVDRRGERPANVRGHSKPRREPKPGAPDKRSPEPYPSPGGTGNRRAVE